jgi:hypothetical protein
LPVGSYEEPAICADALAADAASKRAAIASLVLINMKVSSLGCGSNFEAAYRS